MAGAGVRVLAPAGATIGESPLCTGNDVLWTDPVQRELLRLEPMGLARTRVEQPIWSLAAHGETVFGTLDRSFCTVAGDGVVAPGPPAGLDAGCRLNDMTIGPDGALWAGAMHRGTLATRGAIFRAASIEAPPNCVAEGLGVPNGMAVAPDGATLFVIDTLVRTLLAYPVVDAGLGEPAILSDFLGLAGKPDGMVLAGDGSFWVAMWGGGSVVQLAPDGALLREIPLPAPHVSSLCLADDDRLLVTTSRMRLGPAVLIAYPHSGDLFEVQR